MEGINVTTFHSSTVLRFRENTFVLECAMNIDKYIREFLWTMVLLCEHVCLLKKSINILSS